MFQLQLTAIYVLQGYSIEIPQSGDWEVTVYI